MNVNKLMGIVGLGMLLTLSHMDMAVALTKPVMGLRDYNGTLPGTPGTGSIGYATLFRDNIDYGATSGCMGEGCGKHPGVDIPVLSGTAVYAAIRGTVLKAVYDCSSSGWGGLVVIQAVNPYTGETIYFSSAHLRKLDVATGRTVSEGQRLGESGGGSGDYCRGSASGMHLHFQIDKVHDGSTPWYPTGRVSQADADFEVVRYALNPIPFLTGGYRWTFDQACFAEYWLPRNVTTWGVNSGVLWIDGNADPGISRSTNVSCGYSRPCSGQVTLEANLYGYVYIGLQNFCISNPVRIYFTTSTDDTWNEAKSVAFNYTAPATYRVFMGGNPGWKGIIKRLRIDPAVNCNPFASDPNYFSAIGVGR